MASNGYLFRQASAAGVWFDWLRHDDPYAALRQGEKATSKGVVSLRLFVGVSIAVRFAVPSCHQGRSADGSDAHPVFAELLGSGVSGCG